MDIKFDKIQELFEKFVMLPRINITIESQLRAMNGYNEWNKRLVNEMIKKFKKIELLKVYNNLLERYFIDPEKHGSTFETKILECTLTFKSFIKALKIFLGGDTSINWTLMYIYKHYMKTGKYYICRFIESNELHVIYEILIESKYTKKSTSDISKFFEKLYEKDELALDEIPIEYRTHKEYISLVKKILNIPFD